MLELPIGSGQLFHQTEGIDQSFYAPMLTGVKYGNGYTNNLLMVQQIPWYKKVSHR